MRYHLISIMHSKCGNFFLACYGVLFIVMLAGWDVVDFKNGVIISFFGNNNSLFIQSVIATMVKLSYYLVFIIFIPICYSEQVAKINSIVFMSYFLSKPVQRRHVVLGTFLSIAIVYLLFITVIFLIFIIYNILFYGVFFGSLYKYIIEYTLITFSAISFLVFSLILTGTIGKGMLIYVIYVMFISNVFVYVVPEDFIFYSFSKYLQEFASWFLPQVNAIMDNSRNPAFSVMLKSVVSAFVFLLLSVIVYNKSGERPVQ